VRTEMPNNLLVTGANASISNRGITQPQKATHKLFSQSLAAAANRLANETTADNSAGISNLVRTAPLSFGGSQRQETEDTSGQGQQSRPQGAENSTIDTPFGTYDRSGPGDGTTQGSTPILDEMRVYFKTHQPGEWMYDPRTRAAFAEIYGEKALVTLDWLGTIPENDDPIWQTRQAVDGNGVPLPEPITWIIKT
jgi:hypothetical protein